MFNWESNIIKCTDCLPIVELESDLNSDEVKISWLVFLYFIDEWAQLKIFDVIGDIMSVKVVLVPAPPLIPLVNIVSRVSPSIDIS